MPEPKGTWGSSEQKIEQAAGTEELEAKHGELRAWNWESIYHIGV